MKPGVSGYVCIRNAIKWDYPVVQAARSLIPISDEVVICDGESDDGTTEMLREFVQTDSRFRLISYPWPHPVGNDRFWVQWLNYTRERLTYDYQITVDADEVLWEGSYETVRELARNNLCGIFKRHNFWKDAKHCAPLNTVCGDTVARCGPTSLYMPSDEPYPAVEPNIRTDAEYFPHLEIFHYGFIRDPDAFMRKSKAVQTMFMGSVDQRLLNMESAGQKWTAGDYFQGQPLQTFDGRHPKVAHQWLRERGHEPE